ncbi:MAG: mechanosensitive ion channel [Anaerolineales bacterium]|nr:mechanosensitive ion channel [Chloroflexota bacterium]MBL6983446.1 mechanosensitive ion channel [Anaerolineales bacterium]
MSDLMNLEFLQIPWLKQLILIILFYILAWVTSFAFRRIARWIVKGESKSGRDQKTSPERRKTLQSLWSNAISFLSFGVATLASLSLFVDLDTLVWVVGLFSAAFGLGARPLISDYLTGIGFIFEDSFAVGEKVEILDREGVVEAINLRNTWMRSPSGELFMIPNGEIRVIRNFSRGKFSTANITIRIASEDLGKALDLLVGLKIEAVDSLPNLLEPWQVISNEGIIGQQAELTIIAKARFGKAAEMRPRLLAFVQERMKDTEIELAA